MFLGVSLFVNCYLPRFSANSNSKSPDLLKAQNKNTKNFNFFLTKASLFAIISLAVADVAHPVERHLAKVEVASSSLVIRSINSLCLWQRLFLFLSKYSTTSKIKKEKAPAKASAFSGATGRTRTGDLLITNQLLYQLSHSSIPGKNRRRVHAKCILHHLLANVKKNRGIYLPPIWAESIYAQYLLPKPYRTGFLPYHWCTYRETLCR